MTITTVTIKAIYKNGKEVTQKRDVEHRLFGTMWDMNKLITNKINKLEKEIKRFNKDLIKIEILEGLY